MLELIFYPNYIRVAHLLWLTRDYRQHENIADKKINIKNSKISVLQCKNRDMKRHRTCFIADTILWVGL